MGWGEDFTTWKSNKQLNPSWKDILDYLQKEKLIVGIDVLSQSIWLNSHIKVKNKSPYLKNWIEKDIYIINDLLDQNKQIMSYECFRDTFMLPPQNKFRRVLWYYKCNTKALEELDQYLSQFKI